MQSPIQRCGVRRRSGFRRALELLLGLSIVVGGVWLLRESPTHWKVMHEVWDKGEGVITASAISKPGPPDPWNALRQKDRQQVVLDYRYRVGNEELTGLRIPAPKQPPDLQRNNRAEAERIAASYQPGTPITIYYNPRAPRQTRLTEQGSGNLFGVTLVCGSLMLLGGVALIWLNCRELIQ